MLSTIRHIIDSEVLWRNILRGLNKTFWHQTVTGKQIENYISATSDSDLSRVFAQYLTTTKIPVLEYKIKGNRLSYRWSNVVPGFNMPVKVTLADNKSRFIKPAETWKVTAIQLSTPDHFRADDN